ncbi:MULTISPECIES: universal stress protein [unclassified Paraflavitalea]|uniref:universal stress protein n=1 Tax=unclassified Paraflavitalea TaxID=2798305 RepID=UPI003D334A76
MFQILAPVDFSPASTVAARTAAKLALDFQAHLHLLYAYNLPIPVPETDFLQLNASALQAEYQHQMNELVEELQKTGLTAISNTVLLGNPKEAILEFAEENRSDLIVLGLKGSGGGLAKMIGSTTTKVLRNTSIPLMLIPADFEAINFQKIVIAVDEFSDIRRHPIRCIKELVHRYHAILTLLHINKSENSVELFPEIRKIDWMQYFPEATLSFETFYHTDVNQGLMEYTESHHTNLLTLLSHRHQFIERIFKEPFSVGLSYKSRIPLLLLPETTEE